MLKKLINCGGGETAPERSWKTTVKKVRLAIWLSLCEV